MNVGVARKLKRNYRRGDKRPDSIISGEESLNRSSRRKGGIGEGLYLGKGAFSDTQRIFRCIEKNGLLFIQPLAALPVIWKSQAPLGRKPN